MRIGCLYCGGRHAWYRCPETARIAQLPCEVPPHNGPYQGTLEVREIPAGVTGNYRSRDPRYWPKKGGAA